MNNIDKIIEYESVAVIYHKEDLYGVLSAAIVKDYYGNIVILDVIAAMFAKLLV